MTSQASIMSTPAAIAFRSEPRLRDALEDIVDAINKILEQGNAAEVLASVQPFIERVMMTQQTVPEFEKVFAEDQYRIVWYFLWEWEEFKGSSETEAAFLARHRRVLEAAGLYAPRAKLTTPAPTKPSAPAKVAPTPVPGQAPGTSAPPAPKKNTSEVPKAPLRQNPPPMAPPQTIPNQGPRPLPTTSAPRVTPTQTLPKGAPKPASKMVPPTAPKVPHKTAGSTSPAVPGPSQGHATKSGEQVRTVVVKRIYAGKPPAGWAETGVDIEPNHATKEYVQFQDVNDEPSDEDYTEQIQEESKKRKRKADAKTKGKKSKKDEDMQVDDADPGVPPPPPRDSKKPRPAPTLCPKVFRVPCNHCSKQVPPIPCRVRETRAKRDGVKVKPGDVGACANCNISKVKCVGLSLGDTVDAPVTKAEALAHQAAYARANATSEDANPKFKTPAHVVDSDEPEIIAFTSTQKKNPPPPSTTTKLPSQVAADLRRAQEASTSAKRGASPKGTIVVNPAAESSQKRGQAPRVPSPAEKHPSPIVVDDDEVEFLMGLSAQELIIRMEERIVQALRQRIDEQFAELEEVTEARWSALAVRLRNLEDLIRGGYISTKRRLGELHESVADLGYKIDPDDEYGFEEEEDTDEDGDHDDADADTDDELSEEQTAMPRAFSAPPMLPCLECQRPAIKVTPATPHSSQQPGENTLNDTLDLEIVPPNPGNGTNAETDADGDLDEDNANILGPLQNPVRGPDVDMEGPEDDREPGMLPEDGREPGMLPEDDREPGMEDVVMGETGHGGNGSHTPSGDLQGDGGMTETETNTLAETNTQPEINTPADFNADDDAETTPNPQQRHAHEQRQVTGENPRPTTLQVPGPPPTALSPRRSPRQRSVSRASLAPNAAPSTNRSRSRSPFAPTEGGSA